MVKIINLCKSFGEHQLFRNFSEEIKDGEFVVVVGQSGCGKTTLLNMIGAIEPFEGGKIVVDDIDISLKKNQRNYLKTKVGFLFQNFALVEKKSVMQNMKMIKKDAMSGTSAEKALEMVGLLEKRNEKVYRLSGGEQQRVALARLLVKKCDIILADEPTGSLDYENAKNVLQLLDDLNKNGKTIILVTHDRNIKNSGRRLIEL